MNRLHSRSTNGVALNNGRIVICFIWPDDDAYRVEITDYIDIGVFENRKDLMMSKLAPIHPGEVLLGDFMEPRGLNANQLALDLRVAANRISLIIRGERSITPETALRLAAYFDTSADFWMGCDKIRAEVTRVASS